MSNIVRATENYWLIESGFGTIVEVSREQYPTLMSAIIEARRHLIEG
tara:strand:+ start:6909 stop:7049 length:141 start_codon:yes stop_codon:yes gene_type:complete